MSITYIAVRIAGLCLLNLTLTEKSTSHTSYFAVTSYILYCSRIRKNVTENKQTENKWQGPALGAAPNMLS